MGPTVQYNIISWNSVVLKIKTQISSLHGLLISNSDAFQIDDYDSIWILNWVVKLCLESWEWIKSPLILKQFWWGQQCNGASSVHHPKMEGKSKHGTLVADEPRLILGFFNCIRFAFENDQGRNPICCCPNTLEQQIMIFCLSRSPFHQFYDD